MIFKTIGIMNRSDDNLTTESISLLSDYLIKMERNVILTESCPLPAKNKLKEEEIAKAVDLIITVGGDGTILHAANLAQNYDTPLLGINRGQLGFLADIKPNEMQSDISQILEGKFTKEARMMLKVRIEKSDGKIYEDRALNDIALQRSETGRMLNFTTSVSNQYINNHSGDGIIIATPTGSTAYSLSCGGPIIDPEINCYVLVPICPHTLSDRPIVMPDTKSIEIKLQQNNKNKAEITIDGRSICDFTESDKLLITKSNKKTILIHPHGYDYYETLRSKLHWGQDNRLKNIAQEDK
ncbi:MAG: NAD(+) kinase [Pseudomonadota bacterium]|nr:NAD(+) kinase [Pseudomonadota bacterium]